MSKFGTLFSYKVSALDFHFLGYTWGLKLAAAEKLDLWPLPSERKGDPRNKGMPQFDIQSDVLFSQPLHISQKIASCFFSFKKKLLSYIYL